MCGDYQNLQNRIKELIWLRNQIANSVNPNQKQIESLNWAIKICQKEVSHKIAKKEQEYYYD